MVNLDLQCLEPVLDWWARPATIHPLKSQPGGANYAARVIWHVDEYKDINAEGTAVISTIEMTLAARLAELPAAKPIKGDRVFVPAHPLKGLTEVGMLEIDDVDDDGVGGTHWTMHRV